MAFISCRGRLTNVLVGAARRETGSKGGGGKVRLPELIPGDFWKFYNKYRIVFES